MHRIQQPTDTTCGQTCVAMLAGVTVDEVCEVMGKKGKTHRKDLARALNHFNFSCTPLIRMTKVLEKDVLRLAIIRLQHPTTKSWTHWVVRKDGEDYDPSSEVCALAYGWKLISFMMVTPYVQDR